MDCLGSCLALASCSGGSAWAPKWANIGVQVPPTAAINPTTAAIMNVFCLLGFFAGSSATFGAAAMLDISAASRGEQSRGWSHGVGPPEGCTGFHSCETIAPTSAPGEGAVFSGPGA